MNLGRIAVGMVIKLIPGSVENRDPRREEHSLFGEEIDVLQRHFVDQGRQIQHLDFDSFTAWPADDSDSSDDPRVASLDALYDRHHRSVSTEEPGILLLSELAPEDRAINLARLAAEFGDDLFRVAKMMKGSKDLQVYEYDPTEDTAHPVAPANMISADARLARENELLASEIGEAARELAETE